MTHDAPFTLISQAGGTPSAFAMLTVAWVILGLVFFLLGLYIGGRLWRQPPQTMYQVKELRAEEEQLRNELRKTGDEPRKPV